MSDDPILKVTNIETYYGPIMAIRGVSLSVPRGQIITVLGANGAGKTTILKTISGVLDPQKGSIELRASRSRGSTPTRSCGWVSATSPRAARSSLSCRCARTLPWARSLRERSRRVARDLERVFVYFRG